MHDCDSMRTAMTNQETPKGAVLPCPGCEGTGKSRGMPFGFSGCRVGPLNCFTCRGLGRVTPERVEFIAEAKTIRSDRIKRGLTIREEGARLKVDFAEWSRIEGGRFPETEAGWKALAVRRRELKSKSD